MTAPHDDVTRVFEAQQRKRWTIARSSAAARITKLRALESAIIERRKELADAVHRDFRKSAHEFELTEMHPVLEEISHTIAHLPEWMEPEKVATTLALAGTQSAVRYEPRGVVLIISPWNYPFNLLLAPLVAAIAAGNTVVLKPSSKTANFAEAAAALIRSVFTEDEVAIFTGGHAVSDALLELPFDHVFFTGSTHVGKKVMRAASEHLATVTLELGGKSPAVVDRSADLSVAASRIMWGKSVNAGQTCVAPDYALVPRELVPEFVAEAKKTIESFFGSTEMARKNSRDFARLIDDHAFGRVKSLIERSVEAGAKVAFGGEFDASERYVAPTVLTGVDGEMPIMKEEIFGPVLPVIAVDSLDHATEFVRNREKPLALYAFGRNRMAVENILANTTAGGTVINEVLIHVGNPNLPFGGVGQSGQGSYHGEYGFKTFSHARAVLDGRRSLLPMFYPPYDRARTKVGRALLRVLE